MIRITLTLPDTLHKRLLVESHAHHKKPTALIRELLAEALHHLEEKRIQHMYVTLKELDGIGNLDIRDASTTIDEVLYGEPKHLSLSSQQKPNK